MIILFHLRLYSHDHVFVPAWLTTKIYYLESGYCCVSILSRERLSTLFSACGPQGFTRHRSRQEYIILYPCAVRIRLYRAGLHPYIMFVLSILVVLYFLLSLASASLPHDVKHVYKRHGTSELPTITPREQTGTHGTKLPPHSCAGRTVFRPKARPWEACYPSKVVSISRSPWSFSARTEGARSASPAKVPGAKPLNYSSVALAPYQLSLVLKRAATASYRCEFLFLPSAPDNSTVTTVSWEVGTFQTALLELNAPEMFLYKPSNSFPPVLTSNSVVSDVFASIDAVLTHQPWGALPLFADKAVGDPASALVTGTSAFTHLTLRFAPCFRCWYCPSRSKLDCHAEGAALEVCECRTWAA